MNSTKQHFWRPEVADYLKTPTQLVACLHGKNISKITTEALRDHVGCLLEAALEENDNIELKQREEILSWLKRLGRVKK